MNPNPLGKNVDRIVDRINSLAFLDKEGDGVHSRQSTVETLCPRRRAIVTLSCTLLSSHNPTGKSLKIKLREPLLL